MQFREMNIDALQRAVNLMVGPDATVVVAKTYEAMAAAMQAAFNEGSLMAFQGGFDAGLEEGRFVAEQDVEDRINASFDIGFFEGFNAAQDEAAEEDYEEGYVNGVSDARVRPAVADQNVQDIISDAAQYAINGEYDVGDSGDEQVQDEA